MGVRLYLNTEDVADLEKCAGVPAGTHALLEEHNKSHPGYRDPQASYEHWEAIQGTDLGKLDVFLTMGFGKFSYPVDDYCGQSSSSLEAVKMVQSASSVDLYACESIVLNLVLKHGVCWS